MKRKEITVLLTSCVKPQDVNNIAIKDISQRLQDYIRNIYFLNDIPNINIVVTDNSDYNYSDIIPNINKNKFEFLHFNGNNYDKKLGKGYGEKMIIEYAFLNSAILSKSDIVIKLTGRTLCNNLEELIEIYTSISYKKNIIQADTNMKLSYADSRIFIAPTSFFTEIFIPNSNYIDESKGIWFEHILAQSIRLSKTHRIRHYLFLRLPQLKGTSGSTGNKLPQNTVIKQIKQYIRFFISKLNIGLW